MQNFLSQILGCIRDNLDEAEIFRTIALACVDALQLSGFEVFLYNADRTRVTARYSYVKTVGESVVRSIHRESFPPGCQLCLMDSPQYCCERWDDGQADLDGRAGDLRSWQITLTQPIADPLGQLGMLRLRRLTPAGFSAEEWGWIDQVVDCCAIALRRLLLAQTVQTQSIELRRLNQLQDTFLSAVSYELRIPLSNIGMAIQMMTLALSKESLAKAAPAKTELVEDCPSQDAPIQEQVVLSPGEFEKIRRYLEVLQKECDRETKLIQDLLDLQQLDTDTLTLMVSAIEIDQWLPYVVHPFLKRFQEYQLQCDLEIEPNLPSLMCDQISLSRLVVELLNNAWRYTPTGERIRITAGQITGQSWGQESGDCSGEPRFCLQVCNSGVEIPIEEMPRIFDKFYRVPKLDIRKQGGTGLGLALVQRLVQRLGGQVTVTSDRRETCFTIELPFHGPRVDPVRGVPAPIEVLPKG